MGLSVNEGKTNLCLLYIIIMVYANECSTACVCVMLKFQLLIFVFLFGF